MKILVTGAHLSPAQAVIEKLLAIPETKIVYLGRKYARDDDRAASIESVLLPKLGVKFIPITAGKLNRFFSFQSMLSFLKTPIGFVQAFYYLSKERPDLIVSFGGFTGLPVVVSGWMLSVPTLIHEQGLSMGLANYLSSFFADKIAVSFEKFKIPFLINEGKIVVTGNPLRREFLDEKISPEKDIKNFIDKAQKRKYPIILVTAGNQGSHKINLCLEDKLKDFTKIAAVIHLTGESKFDDFNNLKKYESDNYLVKKWIDATEFAYALEKADLTVCRGGMNTLIELSIKSAPALIIPIPIGSEQKENAKFFSKLGLGEVLEEKQLTPDLFLERVKDLLNKKSMIKSDAENAKKAVMLGAENRLVQEILKMENQQEKLSLGY